MAAHPALEHGRGSAAGWLRANRLWLALAVALVETVLVVLNVLQWRWALLAAAAVFVFYLAVGRRSRSATLRQVAGTAALSQTIPVLVPLLVAVVTTLVVAAVVVGALLVLAVLLLDRR